MTRRKMTSRVIAILFFGSAVLLETPGVFAADRFQQDTCNIKGNISTRTGEKIYHVPGQRYYNITDINPEEGERWFCSEEEARKAGWRKSKV